jgi:phosphate butyryltransferase
MALKNLNELLERAKQKSGSKIVIASAEDKAVLLAIMAAMMNGIVTPILVGNSDIIRRTMDEIGLDQSGITIINSASVEEAANNAVKLIHDGYGDILMKGNIQTGILLKAALNKEFGLKHEGILSHFALFELGSYHKLLGVTDAAMNIAPDLTAKIAILDNAASVMRRLGIKLPKIAVLCPVETVNPKIESTVHAAILSSMNKEGKITGCLVEGPYSLDIAVSAEAAKHKGIVSTVAGDPDIILCPNLDTGNALYKSINFLAGGMVAAIITGAHVPIVLTSRSDSEQSKFMSIILAAAME